jgi:hypothetical protein
MLRKSYAEPEFEALRLENGQFAYLSIRENLQFMIDRNLIRMDDLPTDEDGRYFIGIDLSADGLPLYKSSRLNLWPILLRVWGSSICLPIACFCGFGKADVTNFTLQLTAELRELLEEGMLVGSYIIRTTKSNIRFICDAPARAYLQVVKGHVALSGCSYCRCTAQRRNYHTIFPTTASDPRSDDDYDECSETNQLGPSPLLGIVNLGSAFVPDYMHAVCLGVARKLFRLLFSAKSGNHGLRVSRNDLCKLNEAITYCRDYIPFEFQRRPRIMDDLDYYKATELRTLLLYLGPVVFRNILQGDVFSHFICLHTAIYILVSDLYSDLYNQAHRCLEMFINKMGDLYGENSLTYNVHILLHLTEFVRKHGPLDNFSAFPFENYLNQLKHRIRRTRGIFKQTITQLYQLRTIQASVSPSSKLKFSASSPDNCCLIGDEVGVITHIDDNTGRVIATKLQFNSPLYEFPYSSKIFQIGKYVKTRGSVQGIPSRKAICIPSDDSYIVIPFAR